MRNTIMISAIVLELIFLIYCVASKSNRNIAGVVCACLLTLSLIATIWLWCKPVYKLPDTTGQYEYASVEVSLKDENRFETYSDKKEPRELDLKLWYPKKYTGEDYSCPLIVFSHGSFGTKESNESLFRELASHGYVVCSIDHSYQCLGNMDSGYRKEIMSCSDKTFQDRKKLLELTRKWMTVRTGDINFVIDKIVNGPFDSDDNYNVVFKLINPLKIGLIGHSLGGSAVLGVGRQRQDISAVICLEAPFMYDMREVTENGFTWNEDSYPIPLLSVYTDSSWKILSKASQYAKNWEILNDSLEITYDMYVKNVGHMTLTDLAYTTPPLCVLFGQNIFINADKYVRKLNQNYLEFFDYYLKNMGEYETLNFDK